MFDIEDEGRMLVIHAWGSKVSWNEIRNRLIPYLGSDDELIRLLYDVDDEKGTLRPEIVLDRFCEALDRAILEGRGENPKFMRYAKVIIASIMRRGWKGPRFDGSTVMKAIFEGPWLQDDKRLVSFDDAEFVKWFDAYERNWGRNHKSEYVTYAYDSSSEGTPEERRYEASSLIEAAQRAVINCPNRSPILVQE